jgi:hypothetical protein
MNRWIILATLVAAEAVTPITLCNTQELLHFKSCVDVFNLTVRKHAVWDLYQRVELSAPENQEGMMFRLGPLDGILLDSQLSMWLDTHSPAERSDREKNIRRIASSFNRQTLKAVFDRFVGHIDREILIENKKLVDQFISIKSHQIAMTKAALDHARKAATELGESLLSARAAVLSHSERFDIIKQKLIELRDATADHPWESENENFVFLRETISIMVQKLADTPNDRIDLHQRVLLGHIDGLLRRGVSPRSIWLAAMGVFYTVIQKVELFVEQSQFRVELEMAETRVDVLTTQLARLENELTKARNIIII